MQEKIRKILLIGKANDDKFVGNSLRHCKRLDKDIHFDYFSIDSAEDIPPFIDEIDNIFYVSRHYPPFLYKIPKVRGYCFLQDIVKSLQFFIERCIIKDVQYDYVHIHILNPVYVKVANGLKKIAGKLIITPWGSDILRAKKRVIPSLVKLAQYSDIITSPQGLRFEKDIMRILKLTKDKLYNLSFGIEAIDELLKIDAVSVNEAKQFIGLDEQFVIVVGYNGNPCHHHMDVIKALASVKDRLPANYILVFPMTYGGSPAYISQIRELLEREQLKYQFVIQYLSSRQIAYLRKATDLFIHAQDTDANSGTVAEYLMCRKKIINPSWISYPHHEKYGCPFYSFDNFDELPEIIIQAIQAAGSIVPERLVEEIKDCSWEVRAKDWVRMYIQA